MPKHKPPVRKPFVDRHPYIAAGAGLIGIGVLTSRSDEWWTRRRLEYDAFKADREKAKADAALRAAERRKYASEITGVTVTTGVADWVTDPNDPRYQAEQDRLAAEKAAAEAAKQAAWEADNEKAELDLADAADDAYQAGLKADQKHATLDAYVAETTGASHLPTTNKPTRI